MMPYYNSNDGSSGGGGGNNNPGGNPAGSTASAATTANIPTALNALQQRQQQLLQQQQQQMQQMQQQQALQQQQQTPKRPRSTSPTAPAGKHLRMTATAAAQNQNINNTNTTAAAAPAVSVSTDSNNLAKFLLRDNSDNNNNSTRNATLNALLKLTASHDLNYALEGDALLKALAFLFYDTVGWWNADGENEEDGNSERQHLNFSAKKAWHKFITSDQKQWADFCASHLTKQNLSQEEMQLLETILVILRNLSYVSANLRLLAYSNDILQILVGCLYEKSQKLVGALEDTDNNATPLCWNALHILININPFLDVTGQALVCDKLFLKSYVESSAEQAKAAAEEAETTTTTATTPSNSSTTTTTTRRSNKTSRTVTEPEKICLPSSNNSFGQAADGTWGFGSMWLAKKLDTKEDLIEDLPHDLLLTLTKSHLIRVWALFPALTKVLTDTLAPRVVTMVALELLEELISQARNQSSGVVVGGAATAGSTDGDGDDEDADSDDDSWDSAEDDDDIPDLREILCYTPDAILQRLVDFLYIPRLSSDCLEYNDPVVNIVTRVNPLRLLAGYDATIDTDVRDRSLEVLVPLCELDSPDMAKRLGTIKKKREKDRKSKRVVNNRIFDAVVPILDAKSGRNEAPLLATQLMRELSRAKENKLGLLYVQERVISIASKDPRVAHLAFNDLYAKSESGQ